MFFRKSPKPELKDKIIQQEKRQHTRKVNKDIKSLQQINKILENGITLEIKQAIGGKHG